MGRFYRWVGRCQVFVLVGGVDQSVDFSFGRYVCWSVGLSVGRMFVGCRYVSMYAAMIF